MSDKQKQKVQDSQFLSEAKERQFQTVVVMDDWIVEFVESI